MIRGILIALLACVVSFSAEASAERVVAKGPVKSLSVVSNNIIGKIFNTKNDKRNTRYYKVAAKKKRQAQAHRRSLLRSQNAR